MTRRRAAPTSVAAVLLFLAAAALRSVPRSVAAAAGDGPGLGTDHPTDWPTPDPLGAKAGKQNRHPVPSGSPSARPSGRPSLVATFRTAAADAGTEGGANPNATATTAVYALSPTDDTFLEAYRHATPLGRRDKLKVDADPDGSPTKVVQLRFGLGGAFRAAASLQHHGGGGGAAAVAVAGARLRLYALADTAFGGYVTRLDGAATGDGDAAWDEATATWDDYVAGKTTPAALFLPHGGDDGDGAAPLLGTLGAVSRGNWYDVDLTAAVAAAHAAGGGAAAELALRIATDSADGVVYASKEHPSGRGPVLEVRFAVAAAGAAAGAATTPEEEGGTGGEIEEEGGAAAPAEDGANANATAAGGVVLDAVPAPVAVTAAPASDPAPADDAGGAAAPPSGATPPTPSAAADGGTEGLHATAAEALPEAESENHGTASSPAEALPGEWWQMAVQRRPGERGGRGGTPDAPGRLSLSLTLSLARRDSIGRRPDRRRGRRARGQRDRPRRRGCVGRVLLLPPDHHRRAGAAAAAAPPRRPRRPRRRGAARPRPPPRPRLRGGPVHPARGRRAGVRGGPRRGGAAGDARRRRRRRRRGRRGRGAPERLPRHGCVQSRLARRRCACPGSPCTAVRNGPVGGASVALRVARPTRRCGPCSPLTLSRGVLPLLAATFDDPQVSDVPSEDAARVLDQATLYAFVGPEEQEFIEIFKGLGAGATMWDGPAEYDVSVLKVQYPAGSGDAGGRDDPSANAHAMGQFAARDAEDEADDASPTSSAWLPPVLIAGASVLVVASSAVALVLWRQRREDAAFWKPRHQHRDLSPRSLETVPATPSPTAFLGRFRHKHHKTFDYAEFEDPDEEVEPPSPSSASARNDVVSHVTTDNARTTGSGPMIRDVKFVKYSHFQNTSFDDSSVSDVSANIMVAKRTPKKQDTSTAAEDNANERQAESLLLDTTLESYNMEAMSALDQVRFENVLQADQSHVDDVVVAESNKYMMANHHYEEFVGNEEGSLSTGAVPSEMYSNLSIDSSVLPLGSHDASAAYGSHLYTLDMLRTKDSSLLELPPPPSDAESDTSSQQDAILGDGANEQQFGTVRDVYPSSPMVTSSPIIPAKGGTEDALARGNSEQDTVSQCINDELIKVMELLQSPKSSAEKVSGEATAEEEETVALRDVPGESSHITPLNMYPRSAHTTDSLKVHNACSVDPSVAMEKSKIALNDHLAEDIVLKDDGIHDGVNVLIEEDSVDAESDAMGESLQLMKHTLSDCMDILEKARGRTAPSIVSPGYNDGDESSLVTEKID